MRLLVNIHQALEESTRLPEFLCLLSAFAFLCSMQHSSLFAIVLSLVYGFWAITSAIVVAREETRKREKLASGKAKYF